MISVLFVCMGNICRSPALQAAFQKLVIDKGVAERFRIASCSVTTFYIGENADERMQKAAEQRGLRIDHIALQFEKKFFEIFDYILPVDREVIAILKQMEPDPEAQKKIHLVTEYSSKYFNQDIPDPYYGSSKSFEHVMDMVLNSIDGLFSFLLKQHSI